MAKIDAEKIAGMVCDLEAQARADMRREIIEDLREAAKAGRDSREFDTWAAGFQTAIEFIEANY